MSRQPARKMQGRERTKKLRDRHRYRRKIMDKYCGAPMKNDYSFEAGCPCEVRLLGGQWIPHTTTDTKLMVGQVFQDGKVHFFSGEWEMRIEAKYVSRQ